MRSTTVGAGLLAGAILLSAAPGVARGIGTFKSFMCSTTTACVVGKNVGKGANAGPGVLGSTNAYAGGIYGETFNPSATSHTVSSGVVGSDASTDGGGLNAGVYGASYKGTAVVASSSLGNALYTQGLPNLIMVPVPAATGVTQNLAEGFSTASAETSVLDSAGNLHLSGEIYTGGSCSTGCAATRTKSGARVTAYHPRESVATIEDVGEGRITGGAGYVHIDSAFGATLDDHSPYVVFVTPEGDSRGLYVTAKTERGFAVRENAGGRSTLSFAYRIVAKPFDADGARLPAYAQRPVSGDRAPHVARLAQP